MKSRKLKTDLSQHQDFPLNYRHHFHAGNFADLMKHALWLQLLAHLRGEGAALYVIDTHAGAGLYDLQDAMARRSKEAEAGIVRLMGDPSAPAAFAPLKAAVRAENPEGVLRFYPGSPLLTVGALRRGDEYIGCEIRADDQADLHTLLTTRIAKGGPKARSVAADGYAQLSAIRSNPQPRLICLIDPPFEGGDEYDQIVLGVRRALRTTPQAIVAIWAPLKDLETFDALLRRLEALGPPSLLVAETRLRPLLNPMKMNGSAMIFIGAPDLEAEAVAICDWVARHCGEVGGGAYVRKLDV